MRGPLLLRCTAPNLLYLIRDPWPWEKPMKRRDFVILIGGVAVTLPLAARAQQPKVPTIGALVIGNISPEEFWREFRQGLRDLGYIEGQNIRFEFRSAEGQINRLPELAAELVRLKVDVIVTWFTPTAVAAKQATREIPIVMAETGDSSTGGKCHRHRERKRRTGRQERPIDPRHAAVGAPGHRSGQRDRSLLQTFPRTDPAWRRSHRNRHQPYQD